MARKELIDLFRKLKLKAFVENYQDIISKENMSIDEIFIELCTLEVSEKYSAKVKRRITHANFPKIKTLAMLDYVLTPKLSRHTIDNLATCDFIKKKENVILVGDSGGGKTHLAIALGMEACKKDFSVKFYTVAQLVNILLKEEKEGNLERFMSKIRKYQLLCVDEVGYVTITKKGAELLFQIFSDRYESGSIIVTSNKHFSKWTEVFIDKTMTTALLDRLTHKANIIKYDWGSIRFNQAYEKHIKSKP